MKTMIRSKLNSWLAQATPIRLSLFAVGGAFLTHFTMYAFRKPFTAGTYEDLSIGGLDYKLIAIVTQVCGYALSKFIGI